MSSEAVNREPAADESWSRALSGHAKRGAISHQAADFGEIEIRRTTQPRPKIFPPTACFSMWIRKCRLVRSVDFTISLPADVVGAEADVQLDCRGRVVRNFEEDGRRGVGVVIDEYRFERR